MSTFGSSNDGNLAQGPCKHIGTLCYRPLFMQGFKGVDSIQHKENESQRMFVSEDVESQTMEGMNSTSLLNVQSLENCCWRGPVCAADKCQAVPGTNVHSGKPPESHTVRTRNGVGQRNVVLELSVLQAKADSQLTLEVTAQQLSISSTALKTGCRKLGIKNWRRFRKAPHVPHKAV